LDLNDTIKFPAELELTPVLPRKSEKKKEIEKKHQYIKGLDDNDEVVQILKEYD
jgi:hypothetical protein